MKTSPERLAAAMAAIILLSTCACTKDRSRDDDSGNMIRIGVMCHPIRSAGLFRDPGSGGYDLVLASEPQTLDHGMEKPPVGVHLEIDIPSGLMGAGSIDLASQEEDPDWTFCYSAGSADDEVSLKGYGDLRYGRLAASFAAGVLHLEFHALDEDGMVVGCSFDGRPDIAGEYIWRWDM